MTEPRHPATEHIKQFFEAGHLTPGPVQDISLRYAAFMLDLLDELEDGPELTVALHELLESKDAAVRAAVVVLKAQGTPPAPNNPEPELRNPPTALDS